MEGTNVETGNIDTDIAHDHSYYGNGCSNDQYPSGEDGSPVSCSTRIVRDYNNDNQKNGTYYHFQAATSGSGGAITTDNTNSSDTFCPLGWQLPYSGTGGDYDDKSRSWNHLFKSYSLHIGDGTATDATKIKSYPFSYVYSGNYIWYTGRLYDQSNDGSYWSSTVVSSTHAYSLDTWSSGVRPANAYNKARGFAVRCNSRVSILNLNHNWYILKP